MWVLDLAASMGRANPDAMLAEMSSAHLTEWMAYQRVKRNPQARPQSVSEARSVLDSMVKKGKRA